MYITHIYNYTIIYTSYTLATTIYIIQMYMCTHITYDTNKKILPL